MNDIERINITRKKVILLMVNYFSLDPDSDLESLDPQKYRKIEEAKEGFEF